MVVDLPRRRVSGGGATLPPLLLSFLTLCFIAALGRADGVAGWRGDGSGVYPDGKPVLNWAGPGAATIRWKTEVGASMSSPVVVGDRVFVTAEPDLLVCVDRDGKVLWKRSTRFADLPEGERVKPPKPPSTSCGYTTPTPVSDGKRVCVVLGTDLVACYSLDGQRLWIRYLGGDRPTQYGRSASPLIVDGMLIVSVSYLQALDLQTGKPRWKADQVHESYGSPAAAWVGDVPAIVTAGGEVVRVRDGKVLAVGIGHCEHVTPVCRGRVVYFIDAEARAVELPDRLADPADAIEVKELWNQDLDGEYFASPVVHDGLIYAVNAKGAFSVLEAAAGKTVMEKELALPAPEKSRRVARFYPSVTLVGAALLVGDDGGGSVWLRPGREYAEVGRNLLPEGAAGSAAFAAGRLYLRGGANLYCIGEQ